MVSWVEDLCPPQTGQGGLEGVIYSCPNHDNPTEEERRAKDISGALTGSEHRGRRLCRGTGGQTHPQVTCRGVSSISMRKVSMGVSPMSLKKKRCSRHFSPMERSAGRRRRSLANLGKSRVRGTREALPALSHLSPSLHRPRFSQKNAFGAFSDLDSLKLSI